MPCVPTYLLHESPEPLDELRLVVAVAPGVAVEGRRGDHEAGRPVPHEGHRVALDHVDEVRHVLGAPLHAHVVHQALQRRQPHVDELACQVETKGGKVTITVMNQIIFNSVPLTPGGNSIDIINFEHKTEHETGPNSGPNSVQGHNKF